MGTIQHNAMTGSDLHTNKIHATTHESAGTDPIPIDTLGSPTANTNLNVSTTTHGLCPVLPNDNTQALRGDGTWGILGGVPTGTVVMWMLSTLPTGWLELNGASVLRATYSALFGVIGTSYGTLDGAHFTLPDLRGYFPRGWDHGAGVDPDEASRTDRGDGTTGDNVGTKEVDVFKAHTHGLASGAQAGPGGGNIGCATGSGSVFQTSSTGGNETRPININMMFIIKT